MNPARSSHLRWSLLALLGLSLAAAGCTDGWTDDGFPSEDDDDDDDDGSGDDDSVPSEGVLELHLDAPSTSLGGSVGYELVVVSSSGEQAVTAEDITSDIEPGLDWSPVDLTPSVAGSHVVTATATVDGSAQEASATLAVTTSSEAAEVDLILSASSFPAGGSITWTVSAWDEGGNPVDASGAAVTASSADVTVTAGQVSGDIMGNYVLTAYLGDVQDGEPFSVTAGAAASIDLELTDTTLEIDESTYAQVTMYDGAGTEVSGDYTLSVDGDGPTSIDGDRITFEAEGWYTVTATIDGTSSSDSVGPFLIDSFGPDLVVEAPGHGTWTSPGTVAVYGHVSDTWSSVTSLTVNGVSVGVAEDGSFSHNVGTSSGLNVVDVVATDGDDNTTSTTRAVLAGNFKSYGSTVPSGMKARLNEGSGGIDTLEAIGEGLISASALDDLIPSPAYSAAEETCVWGYCWTWYAVTLYVSNPHLGSTQLQIDPLGSGQLKATMTVYDASLQWSADATVAEVDFSGSGSVSADSISVALTLTPSVSGGQLHATVNTVSVTSTGFHFDVDSWLYDALEYFGISFDSLIQGYMEDALEGAVQDALPDLLEDTLQSLELAYSFDFFDRTYTLEATPDGVSVDNTGITLSLGTQFTADTWASPHTGLGSLYSAYGAPSFGSSPGMVLGVNDDFLNQVFLGMWGGGLLDLQMDLADLGVDLSDVEDLLPGVSDLTLTTEALLPPIVEPGTGDGLMDLAVGDLLLTLYSGSPEPGHEYLQAYISAVAGLDVSVSDGMLSPTVGDFSAWFDVIHPVANSAEAADYELLLTFAVPGLLPVLTTGLGEIAIPELAGFTMSGLSIGSGGPEGGWITIGGSLVGG